MSASTTCTSLATTCGSQGTLVPNYAAIPEVASTESSSEDEQDSFEKTRRHFQQLRQISLGNEFKYKMEMEIKSAKEENLRNSVPFVKQLSKDSIKVKTDYAINGDAQPYGPTTQRLFLWTQVSDRFFLFLMGNFISYNWYIVFVSTHNKIRSVYHPNNTLVYLTSLYLFQNIKNIILKYFCP